MRTICYYFNPDLISPGNLAYRFLSKHDKYIKNCKEQAKTFVSGWNSYLEENQIQLIQRKTIQNMVCQFQRNNIKSINNATLYFSPILFIGFVFIGFVSSWTSAALITTAIAASFFAFIYFIIINDTNKYESGRFCAELESIGRKTRILTELLKERITMRKTEIINIESARDVKATVAKNLLSDVADYPQVKTKIESLDGLILLFLTTKLLFHYAKGAYEDKPLMSEDSSPLFHPQTAEEIIRLRYKETFSPEEIEQAYLALRQEDNYYQNLPEKLKPLAQLSWREINSTSLISQLLVKMIFQSKLPENQQTLIG